MYTPSFHSFPILVTHFLDTVCAKDAYKTEGVGCCQAGGLLTTVCLPDLKTLFVFNLTYLSTLTFSPCLQVLKEWWELAWDTMVLEGGWLRTGENAFIFLNKKSTPNSLATVRSSWTTVCIVCACVCMYLCLHICMYMVMYLVCVYVHVLHVWEFTCCPG